MTESSGWPGVRGIFEMKKCVLFFFQPRCPPVVRHKSKSNIVSWTNKIANDLSPALTQSWDVCFKKTRRVVCKEKWQKTNPPVIVLLSYSFKRERAKENLVQGSKKKGQNIWSRFIMHACERW